MGVPRFMLAYDKLSNSSDGPVECRTVPECFDDAIDLGGCFRRKEKMLCGDGISLQLLRAVGHAGGKAVIHDASVLPFAQHGESDTASVLKTKLILLTRIAIRDLLAHALFEQHQWDPSVDDRRGISSDVAYLRKRQLGGEKDFLKAQLGQLADAASVGDV